jgi:hypothetical protein
MQWSLGVTLISLAASAVLATGCVSPGVDKALVGHSLRVIRQHL